MENKKNYQIKWERKKRQEVIKHLGSKCVRCSFNDWRALQIDHIEANGKSDTRIMGSGAYHLRVLKDKTGKYQLLCANCNWIKRYENSEHKRKE